MISTTGYSTMVSSMGHPAMSTCDYVTTDVLPGEIIFSVICVGLAALIVLAIVWVHYFV